jgi:hypothetical protein
MVKLSKWGCILSQDFRTALKMEIVCSPKFWYVPMSPHATTRQQNITVFTAVRMSDLTYMFESD